MLLGLGLTMLYSAGKGIRPANPDYFFLRQLRWVILGIIGLCVTYMFDYHIWQRYSVAIILGALLLLIIVLITGKDVHGSTRWLIKVNGEGSVQPSEFARLALIIYIAHWLASKQERLSEIAYGLLPFAIILGIVATLVIAQPDFSMAILMVMTAFVMFFVAGADIRHWLGSLMIGGMTGVFIARWKGYIFERITIFLKFLKYLGGQAEETGGEFFQMKQVLKALISGGLTGKGLGKAEIAPTLSFTLPTDGILAIVGEELGVLGCLFLLGLLAFLAYRGFKIALEAPDPFGSILASGITWSLVLQAFIHIGSLSASIPFTGIPLPFVSYGGSSLVVCMTSVGLLLSISRSGKPLSGGGRKVASYDYRRRNRRSRLSRSRRRRSIAR